tara:strand:- start:13933 stop:14103 length:171 start_codon:yes stop_codon:yes gene_type:complete
VIKENEPKERTIFKGIFLLRSKTIIIFLKSFQGFRVFKRKIIIYTGKKGVASKKLY